MKEKELSLPYYLPIGGVKKRYIHAFPKDIKTK